MGPKVNGSAVDNIFKPYTGEALVQSTTAKGWLVFNLESTLFFVARSLQSK